MCPAFTLRDLFPELWLQVQFVHGLDEAADVVAEDSAQRNNFLPNRTAVRGFRWAKPGTVGGAESPRRRKALFFFVPEKVYRVLPQILPFLVVEAHASDPPRPPRDA